MTICPLSEIIIPEDFEDHIAAVKNIIVDRSADLSVAANGSSPGSSGAGVFEPVVPYRQILECLASGYPCSLHRDEVERRIIAIESKSLNSNYLFIVYRGCVRSNGYGHSTSGDKRAIASGPR